MKNIKKVHKRYILVFFVLIMVLSIIYKLSTSYAYKDKPNNNIVSGDEWSINIVSIINKEMIGGATFVDKVNTMGNTLDFEIKLPNPESMISYDVIVENMGKLDAELYALSLTGLTEIQKEFINYEVIPLDYVNIKSDKNSGSVIKKNERHTFRILVNYQSNVNKNNIINNNLNLGLTVIYKQK